MGRLGSFFSGPQVHSYPALMSAGTIAEIEQLLNAGRPADALRSAERLCAKSRRHVAAWLCAAQAHTMLGNVDGADRALETAFALAPTDDRVRLMGGRVDQQLGRMDRSAERLRAVARGRSPDAREAWMALCDTLYIANRIQELRDEVARPVSWSDDLRYAFHAARAHAAADPERALATFMQVATEAPWPTVRRVAGFDAVRMLDKAGRYQEAFALAQRVHADTGAPFDLEGALSPLRMQRELLAKGGRWFEPQADRVEDLAMVIAMPRSGTTLLEQMLDRHPAISGIGEYEGTRLLSDALTSAGRAGKGLAQLTRAEANDLQRDFLSDARRRKRPGASWMFDKNLRGWRHLPAIAAVLPGTRCITVRRDPRDTAISILLSYFHPINDGWTASLESIRQLMDARDAILPNALAALGLPHEVVYYEDLVDAPAENASRCLRMMGLELTDEVLRPEENTRVAFTLSHAQVQSPINRSSIGRWRNYQWAFGPEWDSLVTRHESRRQ